MSNDKKDFDKLKTLKAPLPSPEKKAAVIARAAFVFEAENRQKSAFHLSNIFHFLKETVWGTNWKAGAAFASVFVVAFGGYIGFQAFLQQPLQEEDNPAPQALGQMREVPVSKTVFPPETMAVKSYAAKNSSTISEKDKTLSLPQAANNADTSVFQQSMVMLEKESAPKKSPGLPMSIARARGNATSALAAALPNETARPLSVTSINGDTPTYSYIRQQIGEGKMPRKDDVHVEDVINSFPYSWPAPETPEMPLKITAHVVPTPWNKDTKLMHIAIQGYAIPMAQEALSGNAAATIPPIANNVEIQAEFNPAVVSDYHLIGYEEQTLNPEKINGIKIDAGNINLGHSITILYEITLKQQNGNKDNIAKKQLDNISFLNIFFKVKDFAIAQKIKMSVTSKDNISTFYDAAEDIRFSIAVAAFAQKLRGVTELSNYSYDAIQALAKEADDTDETGYKQKFIKLISAAKAISHEK